MGQNRFGELDALRGFAALWVVLFHYVATLGLLQKEGLAYISLKDPFGATQGWPAGVINLEGLRAVDLFFVISGFVIFMTVKNAASVWDFIVARVARLYPAYLFSVVVTALIILAFPIQQQHLTFSQLMLNLTMFEDFFGARPINNVYWSLSYELGFYFCIVLLFALQAFRRIEMFGLVWITVSFVAIKLAPIFGHELPWRIATAFALPYASLFLSGILWYLTWSDGVTLSRLGLLFLSYCEYSAFKGLQLGLITLAIYLTFWASVSGNMSFLKWRPFAYLGSISYSLYLIHVPIGERLEMLFYWLKLPPYLSFTVAVLVALIVAALITEFVDRPGHRAITRAYRYFKAQRSLAPAK